jgi:gas vesicle protein
MPTVPASTADEIADSIRSLIDRLADANVTREMARRGQDVAGMVAERGADVGDRASEVWRDTRPLRRDAAKRMSRAGGEAARWSDRTWRSSLRPLLKDLWTRRTVAIGAAGAAVPVGRELVDTAAARLRQRERQEQRHWGAVFLGLLLGAAAGAIVAMLTTPKRGVEMRQELGTKADEVRAELSTKADEVRSELSARAKEAEWVPIFQRDEATNGSIGETISDASGSVQEAAAEAGSDGGEAAEEAATETSEAISEALDTADRESQA